MKTLHVFRKDLLILLKDRGTYINLFALPLIFSVVLTLALGGVFGGGSSKSPVVVPVAASTQQAKETAKLFTHIPGITWKRMSAADARAAVSKSTSLGAVLVSDSGAKITFYEDPAQLTNAKLVYGEISSVVTAKQLSQQQSAAASSTAASSTGIQAAASPAPAAPVTVAATRAGTSAKAQQPTAAEQYIPGFTVAFLFFIASTIAQYMFMERDRGTLRRLMASPVSKASILTGKLLPNVIVGFGQVAVIFAVGRLLFGMNLGDPLALFLITLAAVAAANGFGLMITALSKTQAQATGLATLFVFLLATIAGCYVPIAFMPPFMQNLTWITPQGWAMHAFQDILIRGADAQAVLPAIGALCGFALIFFLVGLSRFRFTER